MVLRMSYKEKQSPTTVTESAGTAAGAPATQHARDDNSDGDVQYRCPYCNATYQHELHVRVHITRADDIDHLNHNGMMPEVEVEVVDENGDVIETISRRPAEIDTDALTAAGYPAEYKEQHRHILLVAARNAQEDTYSTIHDKVEERLAERDIEVPSYSTTRRVIRDFYQPTRGTTSAEKTSESDQTLGGYTAKQQAILIARVVSPEAPAITIAKQIGCAPSYPSQVLSEADAIVDQLASEAAEADDLDAAIRDALTDEDIRELDERGLLEDVEIDLPVDDQDGETDTADKTDAADESDSEWGSPIADANVMSAAPEGFEQATIGDDDDATGGIETDGADAADADSHSGEAETTESADETGDDPAPETPIPKKELQDLKEKIGFLRATFARSVDSDTDSDAAEYAVVVGVAEQIEQQCEAIIETYTQAE